MGVLHVVTEECEERAGLLGVGVHSVPGDPGLAIMTSGT